MMARDVDPRLRMVGVFSQHLSGCGWHVDDVYRFAQFVRDLEDPNTTPDELQKEFPEPWITAVLSAFAAQPRRNPSNSGPTNHP